jgi:CheY-like chemotaxis protein
MFHVAHDGEEALDFLFCRGAHNHCGFDKPLRLVLLDLKLPKVDGLEVLRQLKSDPRTKAIPIVILTSSREERDMVNGYQLDANSHIQKAVDFVEFQEIIKQLGLYWLVVNQAPPPNAFISNPE